VQGAFAGSSPTMVASSPIGAPCLRSSTPGLRSALSKPSGGSSGSLFKGSPSGSVAFHGRLFYDVVKRNLNPSSCLVQEAPTPSISLRKDAITKLARLSSTTLICHFNGLWPRLFNIHDWISGSWFPVLKGDVFIHPCAQGFFIVEFDLQEDRDLIFSSGP
jgi:hypothetical protein